MPLRSATSCVVVFALVAGGCTQTNPLGDWGDSSLRNGINLRAPSDFRTAVLERRASPRTDAATDTTSRTEIFTLEEAINRALIANRGLQDAADRELGAALTLQQSRSGFDLKVRPRVTSGVNIGEDGDAFERFGVGVSLEQRFESGGFVRVSPGVDRIDEAYRSAVDFGLTQPLLRGAGRLPGRAAIEQAEFSQRSAQRAAYQSRVNIVLQVVTVFHACQRQRDIVALEEAGLERVSAHAEATRLKHGMGMVESVDVSRAELQLRQVEDSLRIARESLFDAMDELRLLLNIPSGDPIKIEGDLTFDPVQVDEDEVAEFALRSRVEIAQAEDSLRDAQRNLLLAEHNTLPELNLGLNYSVFGFEDEFADSSRLDRSSLGVTLSTSTDVARTSERIAAEQSRLNVRGVGRSLERTREEIARQARRESRGIVRVIARMDSQRQQIKLAQGKLEVANVRITRGLGGNFDLIEAENELRRAQASLIAAIAEHGVATYRLRAAMGSLIEPPSSGVQIEQDP